MTTTRHTLTTVERMWHIRDSQVQIRANVAHMRQSLALAFRVKTSHLFLLFPHRSRADPEGVLHDVIADDEA